MFATFCISTGDFRTLYNVCLIFSNLCQKPRDIADFVLLVDGIEGRDQFIRPGLIETLAGAVAGLLLVVVRAHGVGR
ncbi:MAG: hypothetical protein ACO3MW_11980, partial [Rhodospirillales bacterium]